MTRGLLLGNVGATLVALEKGGLPDDLAQAVAAVRLNFGMRNEWEGHQKTYSRSIHQTRNRSMAAKKM
jgi:hypothetical protein